MGCSDITPPTGTAARARTHIHTPDGVLSTQCFSERIKGIICIISAKLHKDTVLFRVTPLLRHKRCTAGTLHNEPLKGLFSLQVPVSFFLLAGSLKYSEHLQFADSLKSMFQIDVLHYFV